MKIAGRILLKKYITVIFTVILLAALLPVTVYAAEVAVNDGLRRYDKDNGEQNAVVVADGHAISVGQASAEKSDAGQQASYAFVIVLIEGTVIILVIGTFISIIYLRSEKHGSKKYRVFQGNAKMTGSGKYTDWKYDVDTEYGENEECISDSEYGGSEEYIVDTEYGVGEEYIADAGYGGNEGYIVDTEYGVNEQYIADAEYAENEGYIADAGYGGNEEYIVDTEYDWNAEYGENAEPEPGADHVIVGKSKSRRKKETRKQKRARRKKEAAVKETYSIEETEPGEETGASRETEPGEETGASIEAESGEETEFTEQKREVPVIKVDNVTMKFKVADGTTSGLKDYVIQKIKKQITTRDLLALDSVSFEVFKGEVVGVIGTNGSGKSTLLKIVSGAMKPTGGQVIVDKSKIQLLTLGTGFDMELTARENVYLNGAIIGYSRQFITEHYDEIVKFAELDGFMDTKVKNFSSGMVSRLGFAIATVGDAAEILILDEVLSVGDEFFRKKSLKRIKEMIHGGSTVIMVSHGMGTIRENCTKVVWIEKGVLQMVGDAGIVCRAYQRMEKNVDS